jgi:hypothetical protein
VVFRPADDAGEVGEVFPEVLAIVLGGLVLDHLGEELAALAVRKGELPAEALLPDAVAEAVQRPALDVRGQPGLEFIRDLLVEGDGDPGSAEAGSEFDQGGRLRTPGQGLDDEVVFRRLDLVEDGELFFVPVNHGGKAFSMGSGVSRGSA